MKCFEDLAGKAVLVTGGSKGIGKDIALSFAEYGARVIISGRNLENLKATAKELQKINPHCSFVSADLLVVEEINQMMETVIKRLGGLDILVNNAGVNIPQPALNVTEQAWDQVLGTNLKAVFFCCQKAAEYMLPLRKGKIINIASQMSFVGYANRAAYCSSKGGVVQLTKALAVEWATHHINVNAVAPTFIHTEFTEKMFADPVFMDDVLNRIPLGRLAEASDVAGAVLFLSSSLANMITGETLKVDGGWTAI